MTPKLRLLIVERSVACPTLADSLALSDYETMEAFLAATPIEKDRAQPSIVCSGCENAGMAGVESTAYCARRNRLASFEMTAMPPTNRSTGVGEGVVGVFEKPLDISQSYPSLPPLKKPRRGHGDDDPVFCRTLEISLPTRF